MSSELRVDKIVPVDGVSSGSGNSPGTSFVGGGGIIQVQMGASENSQYISDNNSWRTTGLNVNITPKFATSKILMRAAFYFGTTSTEFTVRFKRNTTLIGTASTMDDQADGSFCIGGGSRYCTGSFEFLDSPNSTSALTYSAFWRKHSGTMYLNRTWDAGAFHGASSLTVYEVSA